MVLVSARGSQNDPRLGHVKICNVGSGTRRGRNNYSVQLFSRGESPRLVREAEVLDWPAQSRTAAALVAAAFAALFPEDTKPAELKRLR